MHRQYPCLFFFSDNTPVSPPPPPPPAKKKKQPVSCFLFPFAFSILTGTTLWTRKSEGADVLGLQTDVVQVLETNSSALLNYQAGKLRKSRPPAIGARPLTVSFLVRAPLLKETTGKSWYPLSLTSLLEGLDLIPRLNPSFQSCSKEQNCRR